jgi:uncharacterized spore protein YtfJ
MSIQQLLQSIGERVSAGASVKQVYGEPLVVGGRTVIPAALVRYAFGGGAGGGKRETEAQQGGGGGGGGRVCASPSGVIEITEGGTRFIAFPDRRGMSAALAIGFVLGAVAASLAQTRRVEVVKRPG